MARPRLALPPAEAILALADAQGVVEVRVTPNASGDALALPAPGAPPVLQLRTTATPEHGKANEAVLRLLSRAIDRPVSSLELVRGATGRTKLVRIGRP